MDTETRNQILLDNGYFHPDDLPINRQGLLSDTQKQALLRSNVFWFFVLTVDIFVIILLFIQLFIATSLIFVFAIWIIFLVGGIFLTVYHIQPVFNDIHNNEVKTASGKIYKKFVASGNRYHKGRFSTVRVNNQIFTVNPRLYDILDEEEGYRFFFVPLTKRIVNIEAY